MRTPNVTLALVALACACGSSGGPSDDTDATQDSASTSSSPSGTDSEATGDLSTTEGDTNGSSSTEPSSDSSSGDSSAIPGPARGILGFDIQLNQGLRVTADDPALARRETLVRFYVDVDEELWDDVSPGGRMLQASFFVRAPDGTELPPETRDVWVAGDSDDGTPGSTIDFAIDSEWMEAGVGYRLELDELDPEVSGLPLPEVLPVYPAKGWASIPLADVAPGLRVTVVPYDYQGGCTPETQLDATFIEALAREVDNFFPVSDLEVTVHEPVPWTSSLATATSLDALLSNVASVRASDGPSPDVYYVGVIDTCTDCADCPPGTGFIPGTSLAEAQYRAAMVRVRGSSDQERIDRTSNTFAHELGHNHNRQHVVCAEQSSEPGAVDPFPDPDGYIQTFGYRFSTATLYGPQQAFDLMSYCSHARWISDHTRDAIATHMAAVTASAGAGAPAAEREHIFAIVDETGEVGERFTTSAPIRDGSGVEVVEIGDSTSVLLRLDPARLEVSTGALAVPYDGRVISVPIE